MGVTGRWGSVVSLSRELSAGYLVRTDAGELLNTPCVFADLQTVVPNSFEIPPEKAKVGARAVHPDVQVRGKTTLGEASSS